MRPNNSTPNSGDNLLADVEAFSLLDILHFLKINYKMIAITTIAGLIIASTWLVLTPKQFEATAKIAMAQIGANNKNINPVWVSIEEPPLMISRLSAPTSFTPEVLSDCGSDDVPTSGLALSASIKFAVPKGVTNMVELKTYGKSPEGALSCAQAIFELIKDTQAKILAPYMTDAKVRLEEDIERLARAKDLIVKADKSDSAMGAAYLATRDEIRFLLDEISVYTNVVSRSQNRVAHLLVPIYASETPIAPKNRVVVASGLFGGLFLGLLLALSRQMWAKLKATT